ncbi:sensor histidine kinase [Sneathiella chinensis]|uniref:histidine kinase n=1 Tax=Sneathiella chinensis TaxID=349750 RepID=A0ABQ5TY99_9PROT|nr:sensor histidine kinase [Sneathiella chinensis]GLQ04877.1 histidine kinase [Sneathiella chinensis]
MTQNGDPEQSGKAQDLSRDKPAVKKTRRKLRDGGEKPKSRRWEPFSSLSRRILALNLFSLVFLAGGILYLDQFRTGLIEARVQALTTNGRMIAEALGESALREVSLTGQIGHLTLETRTIRQVLRRLAVVTKTPARLYNRDGRLIADSRLLISAGREIIFEDLPPPDETRGVEKILGDFYDFIASLIPDTRDYPLYPGNSAVSAKEFYEVEGALRGEIGSVIRQTRDGTLMLTVAVPVQGFKHILGGLMLVESGQAIDDAVKAAQVTTLIVFTVTVMITLLLSLYLARTIATPIHRLSEAADKVRLGLGRRVDLPDFSRRRDEIGDLSVSFRKMTAALYDRMDAVEAFAADVAHELKNPLTSLGTAIDTFERVKDEETRKKLEAVISSDVKRLDRLITDISAASRLDAELSRTEGEPVEMVKLIDGVVDMYRNGNNNGVTVSFETTHNEIVVQGAPGRLGQVLRNLIDNALSFSPQGGTVQVRLTEHEGNGDGNWVQVDVEDQGPGIPENKLEAIFNRFYTERPQSEGFGRHSGLGLSISRLIVDAHGGTLSASNRMSPDGGIIGAKFTMRMWK